MRGIARDRAARAGRRGAFPPAAAPHARQRRRLSRQAGPVRCRGSGNRKGRLPDCETDSWALPQNGASGDFQAGHLGLHYAAVTRSRRSTQPARPAQEAPFHGRSGQIKEEVWSARSIPALRSNDPGTRGSGPPCVEHLRRTGGRVAHSPNKRPFFSLEERISIAREVLGTIRTCGSRVFPDCSRISCARTMRA
ncbi:protein of unknown function [Cupriavidus taiwanensis]|nr:protein of unknown function [Cupriavidus taiwanensis]